MFPAVRSCYLSNLVFQPSPTSSRILGLEELHNEQDYNSYIAPHQGSSWPGAVLRFTVNDALRSTGAMTLTRAQGLPAMRTVSDVASVSTTSLNDIENTSATKAPYLAPQSGPAPVAEERQNQRVQIENERRFILERIRERTSSRTGLIAEPHWSSECCLPLPTRTLAKIISRLADSDNDSKHAVGAPGTF